MQKFIIKVDLHTPQSVFESDAECFILPADIASSDLQTLISKAHRKNRILLTTQPNVCLEQGLDGVLLDLSKSEHIAADYRTLTKGLKGRFIGAVCRNRRHEAMILSECEPDFIVFRAWKEGAEKVRELTDWYNEFFLIQSALLPMDSDLDTSTFHTDFVIKSAE
jgi:hypothetical protein